LSPLFGHKDHGESADQENPALRAEFERLNALPIPQLAAEVMRKGFGPGGPGADDDNVTVGQQNANAGPDAYDIAYQFVSYESQPFGSPSADEILYRHIVRLVAEGLQELEHASLVRAQMHTDSGSLDYATTRAGRAALTSGELETILGG
jgi:hypothetical protein